MPSKKMVEKRDVLGREAHAIDYEALRYRQRSVPAAHFLFLRLESGRLVSNLFVLPAARRSAPCRLGRCRLAAARAA